MTPIEKAENALNRRIERLQANLLETKSEATRLYLFQSLVVSIGIGEALTAYIKMIGHYAQARHHELRQEHATLTAQHDDLLKSGNELLERLKANPGDGAIRKEIQRAQQSMAATQKNVRRGANALQREVAPGLAMIDKVAVTIKRLGEADQIDALQRAIKMAIENVRAFYHAQPTVRGRDLIDAATWENSAASEIEQASDSHESYARAGYQVVLALELMIMAVSETPPATGEEAITRGSESVRTRLKKVTARFTTDQA